MKWSHTSSVALAVAAAMVIAGCSSSGNSGSSGSSTDSSGTSTEPSGSAATGSSSSGGVTVQQAVDTCIKASSNTEQAAVKVDTSKYKKSAPWVLGVSAASTTSDSYVVYFFAELKYAVSQDSHFSKTIVLDAGYNASKQVSDIESLVRQKVSAILFSPSDSKAIEPALAQAKAAGIPTIQMLSAYEKDPNIVATATVDLNKYYANAAAVLFDAMGGKGEVAMVRTIAGVSEDTLQTQAVDCVLKEYPGIKIVDSQYTSYATPQAQTAAQAWAVRFPNLAGVLSVYAETSLGVYNAFSQAGRINSIKISPGNVENGWLKVASANPALNLGGVSYPVTLGENAVRLVHSVLSGETVPAGSLIGGDYISPKDYAAQYQSSKPASYWPNDLPANLQPAQ